MARFTYRSPKTQLQPPDGATHSNTKPSSKKTGATAHILFVGSDLR
jgi:hypothetical protein